MFEIERIVEIQCALIKLLLKNNFFWFSGTNYGEATDDES